MISYQGTLPVKRDWIDIDRLMRTLLVAMCIVALILALIVGLLDRRLSEMESNVLIYQEQMSDLAADQLGDYR